MGFIRGNTRLLIYIVSDNTCLECVSAKQRDIYKSFIANGTNSRDWLHKIALNDGILKG